MSVLEAAVFWRKPPACLIVILWCALLCAAALAQEPGDPAAKGWRTHSLGAVRGNGSLSLGLQIWHDRLRVRNLVLRNYLDLAPGIRAHLGLRRRENEWRRRPFSPDVDEAYLEGMTFFRDNNHNLAFNLKVGRVRYLRFPVPDRLSVFDQVPGIRDLTGGPVTDYRGALLIFEGAHRSGLGVHFGGISWGFDSDQRGTNAVEWYGFLRRSFGSGWRFEGRLGALAVRVEPLGRPARRGGNVFLSREVGEFEIGAMYEKLRGYPAYTGVMVRFRSTDITRFLGRVAFDYARKPEGFAFQYDLLDWTINASSAPAPGEELVGEVRAVRLRTYWQQSFLRNEYEHRISSWGETRCAGLRMVAEEKPWYLELEALVSPHVSVRSEWLRDRQGPAQLAQEVVYRFYRKREARKGEGSHAAR